MRMKNAALLVIALLLFGCSCACGKEEPIPPTSAALEYTATWQEQYDLGVRFLSDGNYQEAVLAFTAAIEIDPKQPDAYYLRGDAYAALATDASDTEEMLQYYENAAADYRMAAELGHSDTTEKADGIQRAIDALNQSTLEEELRRIRAENGAFLDQMLEEFEAEKLEEAAMLLEQDGYEALKESVTDALMMDAIRRKSDYVVVRGITMQFSDAGLAALNEFCFPVEAGNGLVMAFYMNPYSDHFCYYGQWESGVRAGHGIWVGRNYGTDANTYIFEGNWENDRPNGEGTLTTIHTSLEATFLDKGSFKNGLYHGTFSTTVFIEKHDLSAKTTPFTVRDGIVVDGAGTEFMGHHDLYYFHGQDWDMTIGREIPDQDDPDSWYQVPGLTCFSYPFTGHVALDYVLPTAESRDNP